MKGEWFLEVLSSALHYRPNEKLELFIAISFTNNVLCYATIKMKYEFSQQPRLKRYPAATRNEAAKRISVKREEINCFAAALRFKKQFKTFIYMDLPAYTKQQLALRNGQDKPQIWVAYKGFIYDMTESRLWRNGKHYEHWAGQDLTDELPDAPHTDAVFEKFVAIGKIK